MKRFFLSLLGAHAMVAAAFSQTANDPGGRVRRVGPEEGIFSWWAASGWTYFLQGSDDLVTWTYFDPYSSIVTGSDIAEEYGFDTTGSPRGFFRVKSVPLTSPTPREADFDGDKIINYDEIAGGTDPLDPPADDDGDGIPNDWETFFHLNPGDPSDAALDGDEDGQSNLAEY